MMKTQFSIEQICKPLLFVNKGLRIIDKENRGPIKINLHNSTMLLPSLTNSASIFFISIKQLDLINFCDSLARASESNETSSDSLTFCTYLLKKPNLFDAGVTLVMGQVLPVHFRVQ